MTKAESSLEQIVKRIEAVIQRESIPQNSESFQDLEWIKFHAKELMPCKDCADKKDDTKQK